MKEYTKEQLEQILSKPKTKVGEHVTFKIGRHEGSGIITGVKLGLGEIVNATTGINKGYGVRFRIKPDNGARAFWTPSLLEQEK